LNVILDTGPLIALLDRTDPHHLWAVEMFESLAPPFLVCDAVLTEATHFLGDSTPLRAAWRAGELVVALDSSQHRDRICTLLEKYAPMDFADACVVTMAELHHPATVITIDRKDFTRYRIFGRNAIRTRIP
jgi:predicted nucleic acid-binding protein